MQKGEGATQMETAKTYRTREKMRSETCKAGVNLIFKASATGVLCLSLVKWHLPPRSPRLVFRLKCIVEMVLLQAVGM